MLDLLIVIIFGIFILNGYKKGFLRTVYGLVTLVFSMLGTRLIYPIISQIIFSTGIVYEPIKEKLISSLDLQNVVVGATIKAQNDFINKLNVPSFIIEKLNENNNPEVYKILDVSSIGDYIGGYMASLIVNIVISAIVFLIIFLVFKTISISINVLSKLPIIKHFDSLLGIGFGFLQGVFVVWIILVFLTLFLSTSSTNGVNEQLNSSYIAHWFYNNNFLLYIISKIIK